MVCSCVLVNACEHPEALLDVPVIFAVASIAVPQLLGLLASAITAALTCQHVVDSRALLFFLAFAQLASTTLPDRRITAFHTRLFWTT